MYSGWRQRALSGTNDAYHLDAGGMICDLFLTPTPSISYEIAPS